MHSYYTLCIMTHKIIHELANESIIGTYGFTQKHTYTHRHSQDYNNQHSHSVNRCLQPLSSAISERCEQLGEISNTAWVKMLSSGSVREPHSALGCDTTTSQSQISVCHTHDNVFFYISRHRQSSAVWAICTVLHNIFNLILKIVFFLYF